MFTCIACAKPVTDKTGENGKNGDEARGCGSPSTREAAKNLSTQIKEVASKFSGLYRQCKPCSGSKGQLPHPDPDGTSSSTAAWDFTSSGHDHSGVSLSAQSCQVVLEDEDEPQEWMAQVEPGVQITFVSLPNGGNDLKRIRFSREMFDKWEAQRWWAENFDRIMELYNVQRFNRQALHTPPRTDDEPRDSAYTKIGSATDSPVPPSFTPRHHYRPGGSRGVYPADSMDLDGSQQYHVGSSVPGGTKAEKSSYDASRTTTSSRDEPLVSVSNASEMETQWVEQDEPGVYITIRQLADGTRELRRVRFSRERFGEAHAKQWWEQNRERIQAQYL